MISDEIFRHVRTSLWIPAAQWNAFIGHTWFRHNFNNYHRHQNHVKFMVCTAVIKPCCTPSYHLWVDWLEVVSSQDKEGASRGMADRSSSSEAVDGSSTQHAFFSKYDAVEKYLKGKGYPPGLTSVEKNTFRRLCSRFAIHGEDSIVDKFLIKKDA